MNDKIKASRKSEKELAKKIGGKLKAGSGNTWKSKGDVSTERFLIDDKTSVSGDMKSYSINREKFYKHIKNATMERKIGLYRINMGKGKGLIILDENDFWELTEEFNDKM